MLQHLICLDKSGHAIWASETNITSHMGSTVAQRLALCLLQHLGSNLDQDTAWSWYVPPVLAWVFSRHSGFLPHPKNILVG
uniref:Uncharacterized protein n=1 Tax=Pyxicephalus adspersus TaxID=30357 RepID=A0AAV3A3K2_PYXAD|nr:TPA: hypothetical protein GDO54_017708 [Pyxicephalus adspersus]